MSETQNPDPDPMTPRPETPTERRDEEPWFLDPKMKTGTGTRTSFIVNWLLVVFLGLFTISVIIALVALNQAISIWFEPQWVPLMRAVFAAAVAALSLKIVIRLWTNRGQALRSEHP